MKEEQQSQFSDAASNSNEGYATMRDPIEQDAIKPDEQLTKNMDEMREQESFIRVKEDLDKSKQEVEEQSDETVWSSLIHSAKDLGSSVLNAVTPSKKEE
jgi:hypothetical protein